MGFLFSKKPPPDPTLEPRAGELAQLAGTALNIGVFEFSAQRPFQRLVLQTIEPRVRFVSLDEVIEPIDGPRATCRLQNARLVVDASDRELNLRVDAELEDHGPFFTLGSDVTITGSATKFAETVTKAFREQVMNATPPSLLVLPGHEELVARAERALWSRTVKLRGLHVFIDQDAGTAVVADGPQELQRCAFMVLGTWSSQSESWLWAWANPSVDPKYVTRLSEVRRDFPNERMPAPFQQDGSRFAAIAAERINADAVATIQLSTTSLLFVALFDFKN